MPSNERKRELARYPIDEQIVVYLYAVNAYHPPMLWVADDLLSNREALLPSLSKHLVEEKTLSRVSALIYLTTELVCSDSSARKDPVLRDAVTTAAMLAKDGLAKERADDALAAFRGEC